MTIKSHHMYVFILLTVRFTWLETHYRDLYSYTVFSSFVFIFINIFQHIQ